MWSKWAVNVSLSGEKDEKSSLSSFSTHFHGGSQSSLRVPPTACLGRALGLNELAQGSPSQDSEAENFYVKQIGVKQNSLTLPFPKPPSLQEFVESVE